MQIRQLHLSTHLPDKLAEFYRDVLELPVSVSQDRIHIKAGSSDLFFESTENGSEPFYHLAFNIPSNSIETAKDWLSQRVELLWIEDYQSVVADFANWKAQSIYFYDTAGNVLELIARKDLHNERKEYFDPTFILSASEAGIVFPSADYEQETRRLINTYSLPFFAKQPPLPQFTALGDDEGLFIVVPDGRTWYPTQKRARLSPMTIHFEHEGKLHQFEWKEET